MRATLAEPEARFTSARTLGDAVQAFLDGDRDIAARKELVRHHVDEARAALARGDGEDDRKTAMRAAGRALALDPTADEAADLVTQLMLAPPRRVPVEVVTQLEALDTAAARAQGKIGALAMTGYLWFVPLLWWTGIRDVRVVVAFALIALLSAGQIFWMSTRQRIPRAGIYASACINAVLIGLVCRIVGPFVIAPTLVLTTLMAYAIHPMFGQIRVVAAILTTGVAVPWLLEIAGVVSPTYEFAHGAMILPLISLTRRRFLQISGTAVGLAAAGVGRPITRTVSGIAASAAGIRRVPTFCDMCFWKCGAIASVKDGRLWKIEGNPDDPLSRGRLCPRGTGGVGAYYDTDRLKAPLVRTGSRGEEKWVQVTWDEALNVVAGKMSAIKSRWGAEAMALFTHGIGGNFFKHTLNAFGSPNVAAPSYAQCRGPRDAGFELTFGEPIGSPERTDIRNARCLVLIGSHLGENMHNTQAQEFAEAVGAGASIIVVDPRFSVAASKAKHYLPIRPGTDLALLLAWMHVIVEEGIYDKEYVAAYGYGFEQFRAAIAPYTPEWAYPETGIAPEIIRETAREMAQHRPATLVHPGRHAAWYGDDTQRSRAIALLNALMGSWGRKGGFWSPASMDVPGYPYPPYPKPSRPRADNPGKKYKFANETLTTGIRTATLTEQPYPIKGWIVYATNLLNSMPAQEETIRAIQTLDLLVVVDALPSEIAGWADVVLPESTYLERYDDLDVESFREAFISLRQPVIESPHDQKPNWWIARTLATKLGLEAWYPWRTIEEYLDYRLTKANLSLRELKIAGVHRGAATPLFFEDGLQPSFPTPSGKIEFYSTQLHDSGFDPIPTFTRPPDAPANAFRLLFGRAPMHTFSRTQSNPLLHELMDENDVWVNADIVARLGLRSGQYVRLRNQDGVLSNRVRVKATERIRADCVYMVHGFGHSSRMLRRALGKGASDAQLVTRYAIDPIMGATGMNVNFVAIEAEA
jgi:thiosulfate reductase/polysulfide reductase chain A